MAFDPFSQNLTFLTSNPQGSFNVSVPELNDYVIYKVEICANFGAQLGASLATLIMLVLLTRPEKRRSAIMIINTLSLIFSLIRTMLQILYFTGPFSNQYAYFAEDYSRIPASSYGTSIAATLFTLFLQISVEASLCLQAWVVCVTLRKLHKRLVGAVSIIVAFMAIAFRIAFVVQNDMAILSQNNEFNLYWIGNATNIVTSVSILWFCTVFVTKLGIAIWQRKRLGLGRFGPMQILFIMGCQTLIIPAILSILQYTVDSPALSSNVLTAVAIFLPLSSLWASAQTSDSQSNSSSARRKFIPTYPTGHSWQAVTSTNQSSPRKESVPTSTASHEGLSLPSSSEQQRFYHDLEKSGLTVNGEFIKGLP